MGLGFFSYSACCFFISSKASTAIDIISSPESQADGKTLRLRSAMLFVVSLLRRGNFFAEHRAFGLLFSETWSQTQQTQKQFPYRFHWLLSHRTLLLGSNAERSLSLQRWKLCIVFLLSWKFQ
ncbi:hypothetical protein GQ457_01G005270 [Hibiscus cannabinus]